MKLVFEKGRNIEIDDEEEVKVTIFKNGKIVIKQIENKNDNLSRYRRKNKYEYEDKNTGKTMKYEIKNEKSQESVKRTINERLRPILENNFLGGYNELFVTLTFKENMSDFNELTRYFDNFWERLCYKFKAFDLGCVYVKEKNSNRDSWHYHIMMKSKNGKKLFIPNEEMKKIWKNGFTKTSRVVKYKVPDEEIDEERAIEFSSSIPNQKFNYNTVIDYMCKLRSKEGYPADGRLFGVKGNLKPPIDLNQKYGIVCPNESHKCIYENNWILKNQENEAIINRGHTEIWVPDRKKDDKKKEDFSKNEQQIKLENIKESDYISDDIDRNNAKNSNVYYIRRVYKKLECERNILFEKYNWKLKDDIMNVCSFYLVKNIWITSQKKYLINDAKITSLNIELKTSIVNNIDKMKESLKYFEKIENQDLLKDKESENLQKILKNFLCYVNEKLNYEKQRLIKEIDGLKNDALKINDKQEGYIKYIKSIIKIHKYDIMNFIFGDEGLKKIKML